MEEVRSSTECADLLKRAKAGDKEAYAAVYRQWYLPVFRYLARRIKSSQTAEDITQSVFLKVYAAKTSFTDQNISPLAYFFTVARHCLADHWAKEGRVTKVALGEAEELADQTNLAETLANKDMVEKALAILTPEQREVIQFKFFKGLETDDIARRLNKSATAIRQIQCRALKTLRQSINP